MNLQGWKVVRIDPHTGDLYSLIVDLGRGGVTYIPGKPTVPKPDCGPLAVFKTYEHAREFVHVNGPWECCILPCRYRRWGGPEWNLWIRAGKGRRFDLPPGTDLASEVTLDMPKGANHEDEGDFGGDKLDMSSRCPVQFVQLSP